MDSRLSELEEVLSTQYPAEKEIFFSLNPSSRLTMREVSKSINQCYFFNQNFNTIRLNKLQYHLVEKPNPEKVEIIIKSNLELLRHVFPSIKLPSSPSSSQFVIKNVTVLQYIYGGHNYLMSTVIKPLFTQLCGSEKNGRMEIRSQLKNKFSSNVNDIDVFDYGPIIEAIKNETFNLGVEPDTNRLILRPETLTAIELFRHQFNESQPQSINHGMYSRLEMVEKILSFYARVAGQLHYNVNKCALFEDAVIATVLKYVLKDDVKVLVHGIKNRRLDEEELSTPIEDKDVDEFFEGLIKPSEDFVLDGSCYDVIGGEFHQRRLHVYLTNPQYFFYQQNLYQEEMSIKQNLLHVTKEQKQLKITS